MSQQSRALASLDTVAPRIFVVVVLYRQSAAESRAVNTLASALQCAGGAHINALLYDNTPPDESVEAVTPPGFAYQRAAANRGMLGAYEAALAQAEEQDCEWLLTLDQDTAVPAEFFAALQPALVAAATDQRIGAIVPHLAEGDRQLSPTYVGIGRPRPLPVGFSGVPRREARAFNSAAVLRVAALRSLDGFDPCFWLDHFDSWLHHQLFLRGWRMYVVGSLTLQHHFSLLDRKNRLSAERFRNFLGAEGAYIDLYGSRFAGLAYTAQLAVRWILQMLRRDPLGIRLATKRVLLQRLTTRRQSRIAHWRGEVGCAAAVEERS